MSQTLLTQVLRRLPSVSDENVLVGAGSFSDAGVYRLRPDCALVQTADFFTPIVDNPFAYGQIAAANALSDVYAMGGRPITALNIVAMPTDRVSPKVIREILRGGASKTREAKCALIGGHTIRNPEPIYGLAVTGIVNPKRMMTNDAARAGDLLVLTKPLGTGIATTGIQRNLASKKLTQRVIAVMRKLNDVGTTLAENRLVRAATDITGFGLIGHLANVCRASKVGAEIVASDVPVIDAEIWSLIARDCVPGGSRANLAAANEFVDWHQTDSSQRTLLTDAQTSGGLLLCVPPRNLAAVRELVRNARVIGRVTRRSIRVI